MWRFDYKTARPTKTALDVFTERDWRVPRLPASGNYDDAGHEYSCAVCDGIPWGYSLVLIAGLATSARGTRSFSVGGGGRWMRVITQPRIGRVLMATGRDATDVAITTSFGVADVKNFYVESYEVDENGVTSAAGGRRDARQEVGAPFGAVVEAQGLRSRRCRWRCRECGRPRSGVAGRRIRSWRLCRRECLSGE